MHLKKWICFHLLLYSAVTRAQVDHWESVVLPGDVWYYHVPQSQPDITWTLPGFDDSSWDDGASGIGYGDDDDATLIDSTLSLYMRIEFNIVTLGEIDSAVLDMDYDDGFVAYLNGVEIGRALMSGDPPAFDQPSDGLHEAGLYRGVDPERFEVDKSLLTEGANILAVEVHNDNLGSSDMTSIPTLSLGVNSANKYYAPVPEWFDMPVVKEDLILESSNLPIVLIETSGAQEIPDEPKIEATMTIIHNGEEVRNFMTDADHPERLEYDGNIEIEIRGSSSACCSPKKQYALTTYDDLGAKDNVSLFGLPRENDWILNAFAFDPSLMRDYISYQFSLRIGQYASRGVYCEVVLNGDYQGVYVLQEKLKADDNRIDINRIDPDDNSGKQLTGGYITKADKTEGSDVAAWYMDTHLGGQTAFVHEHPKPTTVTPQQDNYIRELFLDLEATAQDHNTSLIDGYPAIIDLPSFIDFMIINELAANVDAYQFSTFFHKDRNAKLRAGPVWDFNLTYGNDLFFWGFDRSHTDRWQFDNGDNVGAKFWKDLYDDPTYRCYFRKRWIDLTRSGQPLHPDQIHLLIDEVVTRIAEGAQRDNARWGTTGDHAAHIATMKQWIEDRIDWITIRLGSERACFGEEAPDLAITRIHYHPMTEDGTGEKDLEFIEITNIGEETANLTGVYIGGTGLVYQFPKNAQLVPGGSVFLANETLAFTEAYGFSPYDEFSRSLNNGGQRIELLNGFGNLIDEVEYDDTAPWPVEADGAGYHLSVIDPNTNNNDPTNWEAVEFERRLLSTRMPASVISIFPNPSNDSFKVRSYSKIITVRIMDLQGRVALDNVQPTGPVISLDIADLTKGIYIIDIQTVDKRYLRRVVVN